jgi:hypothetical protein
VRAPWVGIVVVVILASGALARADAVGPRPQFCERGLRPETSHGGPYCALDSCDAAGACTDARTCVARSFCVLPRTGMGRSGSFIDETATMECTTDADCAGVGTCRPVHVCMDVDAFRLRGLVLFSIGFVALVLVLVLGALALRDRRPFARLRR